MKKQAGNTVPNSDRQPIVDRCYTKAADGEIVKCSKAEDQFCSIFVSPAAKWRLGDCPMADDFLKTKTENKAAQKVRVGQQKQKK
jgi:hypothetical protein